MQIKIYKNNEKIKIKIDSDEKDFVFDTIDELIDKFVIIDKTDFNLECEDQLLYTYRDLIQNIFDESKKADFINAYNLLNKDEVSNEEIIKSIGEEDEI